MKRLLSLLFCSLLFSAGPPPRFTGETLHYSVNWPTGLSLGEASLTATADGDGHAFSLSMDAGIPGFAVLLDTKSKATGQLCSTELEKNFTRGKRKTQEKTAFDTAKLKATRQTVGGGKSEMNISPCAKDALTFLYFIRQELASGRVPPPQTVYYGAGYQVRLEYGGTQMLRLGVGTVEVDKLLLSIKGPASQSSAELFFRRDAQRTPVLFKVPFSLGTFSMELSS